MIKQYTGVFGFKHLIKWCFPEAVAAFEHCSKDHDDAYNQDDPTAWNYIDWSKGDAATAEADARWLQCAIMAAGYDMELQADAYTFYKAERIWGRTRAKLWKLGLRY